MKTWICINIHSIVIIIQKKKKKKTIDEVSVDSILPIHDGPKYREKGCSRGNTKVWKYARSETRYTRQRYRQKRIRCRGIEDFRGKQFTSLQCRAISDFHVGRHQISQSGNKLFGSIVAARTSPLFLPAKPASFRYIAERNLKTTSPYLQYS